MPLSRRLLLAGTAATFAGAAPRFTRLAMAQQSPASPVVGGNSGVLISALVSALPLPPLLIGVGEWTLQPGASIEFTVPGPELYAIESGLVSAGVEGAAAVALPDTTAAVVATPGVDYTLRPGDELHVEPGVRHILRNDGEQPAGLVNVVLFPASASVPASLGQVEYPAGVQFEALATESVDAPSLLPTGSATITLERLRAEPGENVTITPAGFQLVILEIGALKVNGQNQREVSAGSTTRVDQTEPPAIANEGDQPAVLLLLSISAASD